MKNMLDRTLPLGSPLMVEDKNGLTKHIPCSNSKIKKILLVSPCGFPEIKHFASLVSTFKQIAESGVGEYVGEILRPAAGIMHEPNWHEKVVSYFELLERAGRQLVEQNAITRETHEALHQLWISPEELRVAANKHFQKKLDEAQGRQ